MFGGVYFRLDRVTHFFDVAMTGGITSNDSTRQVAHNLAPAGQETATASYNGWFVSPEFTYGVRIPVASNAYADAERQVPLHRRASIGLYRGGLLANAHGERAHVPQSRAEDRVRVVANQRDERGLA